MRRYGFARNWDETDDADWPRADAKNARKSASLFCDLCVLSRSSVSSIPPVPPCDINLSILWLKAALPWPSRTLRACLKTGEWRDAGPRIPGRQEPAALQ